MIKNDLALKLWDLSNLTVGFSVVQAMAFFYMAVEGKLVKLFSNTFSILFTLVVCFAGCILYLAILWGCNKGAKELLSSDSSWQDVEEVWIKSTKFRYCIIILFTSLSLILYIYLFLKYNCY